MATPATRFSRLAAIIAMALLLPAAGLQAHGEAGEHVDDLEAHLTEYEDNVRSLTSTADALVADYAPDQDLSGRLAELIQQWERVKIHAAVEKRATPLYGPIWTAIGGLRRAVDNRAPKDEVRKRRDELETALWQGLGAVKLAAKQGGGGREAGRDEAHAAGGEDASATIHRIAEDLDQAAARYADGEVDSARKLIQETYLQRFEGLEGELIERDPELVADLEEDFNATLPNLMADDASRSKVRDRVAKMKARLEKAEEILAAAEEDEEDVF